MADLPPGPSPDLLPDCERYFPDCERYFPDCERYFPDCERYFTVFAGSSPEVVAHAKLFWSSVSLQPPLESSLDSVDIRQRLRVAKAPQPASHGPKNPALPTEDDEILQRASQRHMQDERRRYMEMAKKRDEIMVLLKKQREERIKKEMISLPHKPSRAGATERPSLKTPPEVLDQDIKDVEALT